MIGLIAWLVLAALVGAGVVAVVFIGLITLLIAGTGVPATGTGRERALVWVSRVFWYGSALLLIGFTTLAVLGLLPKP